VSKGRSKKGITWEEVADMMTSTNDEYRLGKKRHYNIDSISQHFYGNRTKLLNKWGADGVRAKAYLAPFRSIIRNPDPRYEHIDHNVSENHTGMDILVSVFRHLSISD
jgi:hypothetical protein